MIDFIANWFNFSNFLYLMILALGTIVTIVSVKYRNLMKEIRDVFEVLRVGYEDGKLTKKEKESVMKEVLDVLSALLKVVWKR